MANRTIRLFVSSTFADFQAERGVLHKDVFPEISRICVPNGFEFEPIDLRWGISDEAVLEGIRLEYVSMRSPGAGPFRRG